MQERDATRRYLSAIEREFSWLKRKQEDEQRDILQLERDRNKLSNDFMQQEKKSENQENMINELKNLQTSHEHNMKELVS